MKISPRLLPAPRTIFPQDSKEIKLDRQVLRQGSIRRVRVVNSSSTDLPGIIVLDNVRIVAESELLSRTTVERGSRLLLTHQ